MAFNLFKRKPKYQEHPGFNHFDQQIRSLLSEDRYIAQKEYWVLMKEIEKDVAEHDHLDASGMLSMWCEKNNYDIKRIEAILLEYKTAKQLFDQHNEAFVAKHIKEDQPYLRDLVTPVDPNIKLDIEQQNVVLRDEDYTLVIAGAGTGKTTTIAAKVRYLVEQKHIDPSRILVVSLTRKATQELKDRINVGLGIPARISTFHSVGYALINKEEPKKLKPVGEGFLFDQIRDFLKKQLENDDFLKKILLFFASYLTPPFNESDTKALHQMLANNDFTTMKSDLEASLVAFKQELAKKKVTLKEERVKSYEELAIANFLYINGIDYQYEPIYEYGFSNSIRAYTPDFLITQGDKRVYLEHFGITENLTSNRYTPEELEKYKRQIQEKEELHRRHHTTLVHTFSSYNDGRDLIEHLKDVLIDNGFALHQRDQKEIYAQLAKNAEDKYFNKLAYFDQPLHFGV
jgi:DNA helicase-4